MLRESNFQHSESIDKELNLALYDALTTEKLLIRQIEIFTDELLNLTEDERNEAIKHISSLSNSLKIVSESRKNLSDSLLTVEKSIDEQQLAYAKYKTDYELSLKESRNTVISAALNAAGKILGEVAGATIRSRSVHKLYEKDRLFEEEHVFSRSRTDATKRLF